MSEELDLLIVGDFNLLRRPENRNKEGADIQEMFLFNEAIINLGMWKNSLATKAVYLD